MSKLQTARSPADVPSAPPQAPWSGTLPFRRYREPFYPEFFNKAATALGLTGNESLVDLGCGTGRVAFGFARCVRTLVGVDAEPPMLERAGREAARRRIPIRLIHSQIEQFHFEGSRIDCATLGNVHWWLDREATHRVLDRLVNDCGKVFLCTALPLYDDATTPWLTEYLAVRRRWNPFDYGRTAIPPREFMDGSGFEPAAKLVHVVAAEVTIDHLVKRALGYHPTSPAVLGERIGEFSEELRLALRPFADKHGFLTDKCLNTGVVFRRRPVSS